MISKVAIVCLFSGLDRELTYGIDERLEGQIQIGSMVKIPLRNTTVAGIVKRIENYNPQNFEYKLKNIYSLVQPEPVLSPDLVELSEWIKAYYAASTQSVLETMIPAVVRNGKQGVVAKEISLSKKISEDDFQAMQRRAPQQAKVYEYLSENNEPILQSALMKLHSV